MKRNHKTESKKAATPKPASIPLTKATVRELFAKDGLQKLFAPVDISSIVFFRIIFGFILLIEVLRYFSHNWISPYWMEPTHFFAYWPFDFLKPLPGDGMKLLFLSMGIMAVCIMLGFLYRIAMSLFFLCFTYMFLLDQTLYLNHFYLVVIVSFLMIFIPANRSGSIDSKIKVGFRKETAPAWCLWLLRFMIGITYFYGGVAKINADWLKGEPLRMWLSGETNIPILGPLLQYDWMIYFLSYSGLILDLFIIPALLFPKTRKWGFILIIVFHLLNTQLFSIGIFPWFMITATTLFLYPNWFRNIVNGINGDKWKLTTSSFPDEYIHKNNVILFFLGIWVMIQICLPLRHFFIPGNVHWTEQGHLYAWHMKLRSKRGKGSYIAQDKKTGQEFIINPREYLSSRQYGKLNRDPHLIWQFCKWVKEDYNNKGMDVAVFANVKASLNGRIYQQLIDSTVDIASQPEPIMQAKWIVPLTTPLENRLKQNRERVNGEEESN